MASSSSSIVHLPIRPARDIPVTFSASFKSWFACFHPGNPFDLTRECLLGGAPERNKAPQRKSGF